MLIRALDGIALGVLPGNPHKKACGATKHVVVSTTLVGNERAAHHPLRAATAGSNMATGALFRSRSPGEPAGKGPPGLHDSADDDLPPGGEGRGTAVEKSRERSSVRG